MSQKKGKIVVLLSSMHIGSNEVADDTQKKPEIIQFYNSTKSGVDVVEKLCATYNVGRSTRRWPMVIFFHLLGGANSRKLGLALLDKQLKRRGQMTKLSRDIKNRLQKYNQPETPQEARESSPEANTSGAANKNRKKMSTMLPE
ncbi:hypothetical protein NQ314_011370 [Rhamnusium bicolor]|uniref:PiggyBac transposable element-derived protein domain-containing protein n=1 Tax=Rhamnusium bicolor TaxID=1586634 RepID=A0AAV8XJ96_9CUCU|nr:hypothetical protein NQ314_011370 [Rhamnusium bicolor]